MHGRLKVRTTAEQAEIKRKEREKKAAAFTGGMKQVFKNRYILEEQENNLTITEKLLSGNPDVSTLWNIRKEIFLEMVDKKGDIDELFRDELRFLQNCLYVNPKSYGVWNQRMFVLNHMSNPNWVEELHLCNLFLKHDERNFHCWDYRRFVVKKSNVSDTDELAFSLDKIKENFSNYSSWHYRSKLLPNIYPDDESVGHVKEEVLLKEFELAQNAFFTDPNDQSAWFYQRWLLGRKDLSPKVLSFSVQRNPGKIVVALSKAANLIDKKSQLVCHVNSNLCKLEWQTLEHSINKSIKNSNSCVWISNFDFNSSSVEISLNSTMIEGDSIVTLSLNGNENFKSFNWCSNDSNDELIFQDSHTTAKSSILFDELEACNMLLEEEPDNKWTMLTIVYIMHALDMLKYESEILELISKLMIVDPMRAGFFKDLQSKYVMEIFIEKLKKSKCSTDSINLEGKNLSALYYSQYFMSTKNLNLKDNLLSSITFLKDLPFLETLNIQGNVNIKMEDIEDAQGWFNGTIVS